MTKRTTTKMTRTVKVRFEFALITYLLVSVVVAFAIYGAWALYDTVTLQFEENCATLAKDRVDKLRAQGEEAEAVYVWVPHAIVACHTCARTNYSNGYQGYTLYYESDGDIIYDYQNYILDEKIEEYSIKTGLP